VAQGLGRVLVVDDDEVIRQLIAVNLTLEGFDVATAVDGQDCLDKVTAIDPDVITLDIMMPRLDGWMTASRRGRLPDQAVRPVGDDPRRQGAGRPSAGCRRRLGPATQVSPGAGRARGTHRTTATAGRAEQARPLMHVQLGWQRVGAETQFPGQARKPGPGDGARERARHGRARAFERGRDESHIVPS